MLLVQPSIRRQRTRIGSRDLLRDLISKCLPHRRDGDEHDGPYEAEDAGVEDDGLFMCLSLLLCKESTNGRVKAHIEAQQAYQIAVGRPQG